MSRNESKLNETATLVRAAGGEATVVPVDLSIFENIEKAVARVKEHYSRIDILINNSGVTRRKPSLEVTEEDWHFVTDLNQKTCFFMCQAVGREMIQQRQGKIVNVASIGGLLAIEESAPYSSSKGGVVQITRVLACEWAKYNVQVNAVAPGYIQTDLIKKAIENKQFHDRIIARTPSKRLGEAEEVVGGVLYLSSHLANYVTGHILMIDGGLSAYGV